MISRWERVELGSPAAKILKVCGIGLETASIFRLANNGQSMIQERFNKFQHSLTMGRIELHVAKTEAVPVHTPIRLLPNQRTFIRQSTCSLINEQILINKRVH